MIYKTQKYCTIKLRYKLIQLLAVARQAVKIEIRIFFLRYLLYILIYYVRIGAPSKDYLFAYICACCSYWTSHGKLQPQLLNGLK